MGDSYIKKSVNNWFDMGWTVFQMFSKWHIKTLANVGPKGETIATPSHCS